MLRSPPSTSNSSTTNEASAMNDPSSSQRVSSLSTPMDSVPFTPNAFFSHSASGMRSSDNLGKCISTIDRVGHFIATADYNFSLERGVLREWSLIDGSEVFVTTSKEKVTTFRKNVTEIKCHLSWIPSLKLDAKLCIFTYILYMYVCMHIYIRI